MKGNALLVGLGEVYDARYNNWSQLSFTNGNVIRMGEYLSNSWKTTVLLEKNATNANITNTLANFANSTDNALLLFYTGHSSKTQLPVNSTNDSSEFIVSYDDYVANTKTVFLKDVILTNSLNQILLAGKKVFCVMETCFAEGLIDLEKISPGNRDNLAIFSSSTKNNYTYFIPGLNSFFFMSLNKIITANSAISFSDLSKKLIVEIDNYKLIYPEINLEPFLYIGKNLTNETFI